MPHVTLYLYYLPYITENNNIMIYNYQLYEFKDGTICFGNTANKKQIYKLFNFIQTSVEIVIESRYIIVLLRCPSN